MSHHYIPEVQGVNGGGVDKENAPTRRAQVVDDAQRCGGNQTFTVPFHERKADVCGRANRQQSLLNWDGCEMGSPAGGQIPPRTLPRERTRHGQYLRRASSGQLRTGSPARVSLGLSPTRTFSRNALLCHKRTLGSRGLWLGYLGE